MAQIAPPVDEEVMLGFDTSDDCAVYKLRDDLAAVLTLDFFTPVVDDPYEYGAIAACNALSDVFAMGVKPLAALNILAFPVSLGTEVVAQVMKGGSDKVREAGAFIVGGHSIDDEEPKYGLAVFGAAHPDDIIRNEGACSGDVLYYSKRLGMGIMNSAFSAKLIDDEAMRPAIEAMMELNRYAAEAFEGLDIHACTDVTGFGLAGHLHEMLESSKVSAILNWDDLVLFDDVYHFSELGCRPGRSYEVQEWAEEFVHKGTLSDDEYGDRMGVLCDPQTSGGLLVALPPEQAASYEKRFEELLGRKPYRIGEVVDGPIGGIFIR